MYVHMHFKLPQTCCPNPLFPLDLMLNGRARKHLGQGWCTHSDTLKNKAKTR